MPRASEKGKPFSDNMPVDTSGIQLSRHAPEPAATDKGNEPRAGPPDDAHGRVEPDSHYAPMDARPGARRAVSREREDAQLAKELDAWMDFHLLSGVPRRRVCLAILSASMDHVRANEVLRQMSLRGKDRVPGDMKGVWTEEDDDCLHSRDPNMYYIVVVKHGQRNLDERKKFWRNVTETEDAPTEASRNRFHSRIQ